jgi:protease II
MHHDSGCNSGPLLLQVYQEVIMGYQPGCYTAKLDWAASADGTAVPVTLAYKTELMTGDGSNKAILHG